MEKQQKPITYITDEAIESVPNISIKGYSKEQCDYIQNQHKELLRYSLDNDNNEVAFVFDGELNNKKMVLIAFHLL